jgi:hypothetical protein
MFGKADGIHDCGKHADGIGTVSFDGRQCGSGAAEKIAAAENYAGNNTGCGKSSDFLGKNIQGWAVEAKAIAAAKHFPAELEQWSSETYLFDG